MINKYFTVLFFFVDSDKLLISQTINSCTLGRWEQIEDFVSFFQIIIITTEKKYFHIPLLLKATFQPNKRSRFELFLYLLLQFHVVK